MWMQQYRKGRALVVLFIALACLASAQALAATRSQLSYWLSDTALEEIKTLASGHPRLAHRSLHVSPRGTTALEEAIAITLRESLNRYQHLQVVVPTAIMIRQPHVAASVDDLHCDVRPAWDNELQVAVLELDRGQVEVQIDLVDTLEPGVAFQAWRWRGKLSQPEREYHAIPAQRNGNDGSLNAPWEEGELEQAATLLSEQLACDLRPNIVSQVKLQWPDQNTIPAPLAAAVGEVRRRVAYHREISESQRGADYRVQVEWHPVAEGVWQLSVAGTPVSDALAGIMAATYIEARLIPVGERARFQPLPASVPLLAPRPGQPASKYLHVQMLDVSQSDRGLARAELRVRLRLVNRASRPMEYGLSLSGGHYLQCIPEPQFYRHDRYGYTEGRLAPGQSIVKVMEVEGARHNPNPFFGTPKCAGFKGLEGLEDFANEGHKVTQFIRWTM